MFENLKKITIKGGCFETSTNLEIFPKHPLSIVYGRNGSGKSTIGNCFNELAKSEDERDTAFEVSADTEIADSHKKSIRVFNEEFVNKQVKVTDDGIATIVMLGEQVEIDSQIADLTSKLEKKELELTLLNEKQARYDNAKDNWSPNYYFERIKDALRSKGGWAERSKEIRGKTIKSSVTPDSVRSLLSLKEPSETLEQLYDSLKADLHLFNTTKSASPITWNAARYRFPGRILEINEILAMRIDQPKLTEREIRLLAMLSQHPDYKKNKTVGLLEEEWEFCPLCLREISKEDRKDMAQTLTDILNEEAKKYELLLKDSLETFSTKEVIFPEFGEGLFDKEIKKAKTALLRFNGFIDTIQQKIYSRQKNLYEPLRDPFTERELQDYMDTLTQLENELKKVEACVNDYNDSIKKRTKLAKSLKYKNDLLARKQHSVLLQQYEKALKAKDGNIRDIDAKIKECETLRDEIKRLKAEKEQTNIALEYINEELQYVFYSDKKISLKEGSGCYEVKVKGKSVKPHQISVGERNVLGLCYFFAKLFGEKTEAAKYSAEYLIVIDDPVSSFDYGNRVGVMSLLRYQFGNILRGNPNSRILVMSHDLQSIFDLMKIRNEVVEVKGSNEKNSFMELVGGKLKVKEHNSEYKKLMDFVYDYAAENGTQEYLDTLDLSIGNIMRRMLEAFSSFNYNMSFEDVLRNTDLINAIPPEKQKYYDSFMYRLILNTESHSAEKAYTLSAINSHFSREEKIQTAKGVLLFLSYINYPHLKSYFKKEEEKLEKIEDWKADEVNWL